MDRQFNAWRPESHKSLVVIVGGQPAGAYQPGAACRHDRANGMCGVAITSALEQIADATTAPGTLVVDTSSLTFMAVCGYAALTDTSTHCRRRGIALHVVGDRPALARVITVCGWHTELPVYPSVAAALQTGPAPDATPTN